MAEYTQNYNLKKPSEEDFYDINDHNNNMDIIDEKLKEAMDKAEQAFQSASNGKTGIATVIGEPADSGDTFAQLAEHISNAKATMAANLTLKGVIAQATESLSALAIKIANIVRGSGNAKPEDVLADKTFSNDDGPNQVGTMPNNGPSSAETITLTTQNQEYTISKGYHTGLRKIKAVISGLAASVIKAGVNVGGIEGTFTSDATATANQILNGYTAYVNGEKITGKIPSKTAATYTPGTSDQTIAAGQYLSGTQTIKGDENLIAANIKNGVKIFNVTGTFTSDATATAADILSGKTAYVNGNKVTGTMANRGDWNGTITLTSSTSGTVTIPSGFHDGSGKVTATVSDADLIASNIRSGKNILGVTGTLIEATGNANTSDVLSGKTFSKAGSAGLTGTMPNQGAKIITPSTVNQAIPAGYHNGQGYVKGDANLIASNIKNGVTIFGVTGTLKALTIGMVPNAGNGSYSGAGTRFYGSNTHAERGTSITDTLITLPLNTVMLELLDYQIYRAMDNDIELRMTELKTRFTIVGSGSITFFLQDSSGKKLVLHQMSSSYVSTNYTDKFLSATVIQLSNGAVAIPFIVASDNSVSPGRAVFSDEGFNLSGASLKITLANGSSDYSHSKSYSIECNYKTWQE